MWSAARPAKISMILCMPERVSGGDENSKVSAIDGINGRDSRYEEWLARYLPQTEITTITSATADTYADIRLELKRLGTPIPPNDVWVAALARQHDLAVLTNDSHFDLVDQIKRIAF